MWEREIKSKKIKRGMTCMYPLHFLDELTFSKSHNLCLLMIVRKTFLCFTDERNLDLLKKMGIGMLWIMFVLEVNYGFPCFLNDMMYRNIW